MEVLAACHLHSLWSYDAKWTLEALRDRFGSRGYRILLMTEHDRGYTAERYQQFRDACAAASTDEVLVVPGMEYSDAANQVHVLVWGTPFLGEGLPTEEMLDAARSANGVAVFAHPTRRQAWQFFTPFWAEHLLGIEIWNRKYDGWAPSETAPSLLRHGKAIPFVGLDFHTEKQSFPLGMALDLPSRFNEETVLDCLRARKCSARAFGLPLTHNLVRKARPALNMAEQGRRTAASIVRYSRTLTS